MELITIMYHDVYGHLPEESGFVGNGPNSYKIGQAQFKAHLTHLKSLFDCKLENSLLPIYCNQSQTKGIILTFDDGGVSAFKTIAPIMERFELTGLFFIPTAYIGQEGFMDPQQIKALSDQGHLIGSHSHSHPDNMANLTNKEILEEWETSKQVIQQILQKNVVAASVPRGYYSKLVETLAWQSGYSYLFNSVPKSSTSSAPKTVLPRYTIRRHTKSIAAITSQNIWFKFQSRVRWSVMKLPKTILGKHYATIREKLLQ